MYASRIAADPPAVAMMEGFAPAIDVLAARNLAGHGFLRAAWYRGDGQQAGRTLVVRRGGNGGAVIAAIPTLPFGPAIIGARKLAGSYWPLRAPLLAPDCSAIELAHALADPAARALGQVCRIGPTRRDDPAITVLIAAAQMAGWRVLSRPAGTSWLLDLDALRANPPRGGSTPRKLRAGWRKLEALGTPRWWTVRGTEWSAAALAAMGQIEADSWIARTTDGSGAKFLTAAKRAVWQEALRDPVIADSLVTIILMLDERPVAFSFDLDDAPVRYAIAGTHVEDLKHCQIGKLANYRSLDAALAGGLQTLDLGAGDSGYKRDMGAVAGYDLVDLLLVRHRIAAHLIAPLWGEALTHDARPAENLARG
jgi:CelD/BcsL family acetyltransferase involved in cellulose biosynthesis